MAEIEERAEVRKKETDEEVEKHLVTERKVEIKPLTERIPIEAEAAEAKELEGLELPSFSLAETPALKSELLSSRVELPGMEELALEIPALTLEPVQNLKPESLSLKLEFPTLEELALRIPGIEIRSPQILRSLPLRERQELPQPVELRLNVPTLRLVSPQRLINMRLQERVSTVISPALKQDSFVMPAEQPQSEPESEIETIEAPVGLETSAGLLEIMFDSRDVERLLQPSGEGQPVIMVAEKSEGFGEYRRALQILCRELYRIKVGGLPKGKLITMRKEQLEEETKAEGRITVITDENLSDFFGSAPLDFGMKESEKKFIESLENLFSQKYGFIIFYLTKGNFENLAGYAEFELSGRENVKLITLKPKTILENPERAKRLASTCWGFVEPSKGALITSFDSCFEACGREFRNTLEKLVAKPEIQSYVKQNEGSESFLHYAMKAFLFDIFSKKGERVEVEKEKVDVLVNSSLALEAETLYGTEGLPFRKITKTLERNVGKETWIVVPNLQAMIYRKDFLKFERWLRKRGESLRFLTLDLRKQELVEMWRESAS
jgi:hypothetical protein